MAKTVNITEKLDFETNPKLIIKDKEYEVNADALTALKIMHIMSDGFESNKIQEAYELIFSEKTRKEIEKLKLSFKDFIIVIHEAVELITGEDEELGE